MKLTKSQQLLIKAGRLKKENARLRAMCKECDMSPLLRLMEQGAEQLNNYRNHPYASGMVDNIRAQLQSKIALIKKQREERKAKLLIEQELSTERICLNEWEKDALERHLTAYIEIAKQEEKDIIKALESIINKLKKSNGELKQISDNREANARP